MAPVFAYFVLAFLLIPLVPFVMAIYPIFKVLVAVFYCGDIDNSGMGPWQVLFNLCSFGGMNEIFKNTKCGKRFYLSWPLAVLFIIIVWLPIALIVALLVSAFLATFGTLAVWIILVTYIIRVIMKALTL